MPRPTALLTLASLLAFGCGPDARRCSGPQPDFVVLLQLSHGSLPSNTVVNVAYGGTGVESYDLANPRTPEVVFCNVSTRDVCGHLDDASDGAAGASGAGSAPELQPEAVPALCCELWTGGYATLQVQGEGLDDTTHKLTPDDSSCTVSQTIVLDTVDAG